MQRDEETGASQPGARGAAGGVPGTWQALVIAGLAAAGFGFWTQSGADAAAAAQGSRLAEVAPQDRPAALDTVDGPPRKQAEPQGRESCGDRLAWVTVVRSPGQPAGRIRLRSGDYVSPSFELTEAPIRVALPYPAPYATGRGTISVLGTTSDAIVALTPPWHVPAQGGAQVQTVTWTPVGDCPAGRR